MNGYFITGIAAGMLGIAIGGGAYAYENRELLTLASWGGKRVLDQALDAGLRRIQGEKS